MNLNKCFFAGRVTRDLEVKYTEAGKCFTNISLAINRSYTDNNGNKKESVSYPLISVWGKQAENAVKYLKKGSECLVECRVETGSRETEGKKTYYTNFIAESIQYGYSAKSEKKDSNGYTDEDKEQAF